MTKPKTVWIGARQYKFNILVRGERYTLINSTNLKSELNRWTKILKSRGIRYVVRKRATPYQRRGTSKQVIYLLYNNRNDWSRWMRRRSR